jgi:hypothetical protein
MSLMFLSYRRRDTAAVARRIFDVLEKEFGRGSVFMDIDTIAGGQDFRVHLEASLARCRVVLALIGPRWMEDERLHHPDDFVRLEIERALSRQLPVVPLLIDGANMPLADDLPSSIAPLTNQQALPIESGRRFSDQMDRFVHDLRQLLGTRVSSGEPMLHAEMVRLQSIINDDVADLCFILTPTMGTSFDDFGFRVSLSRLGSLFCFTAEGNLLIADRAGNTIRSLPATGSSLDDGHAFYSVDLQVGKKAVPEHALVHLRLADLETASFDFMVKSGALPRIDMCYAVSVTAVVSNWFVDCGSFVLKTPIRDIWLPVFKNFVSASPFAEDFQLRVVAQEDAGPKGQDSESIALDTMLATIRTYAERSQRISQVLSLPSSTASSYRIPVSYRFPIEFNRMIAHYGYGAMGDAKILLHKVVPGRSRPNTSVDAGAAQTTQLTALFLMESLRHALDDHSSRTPPQPLQALVGWMLSYWTFLDREDRAQYTESPLSRVVVLCPVDRGTWLWHLEGRLHSDWEPQWTAMSSAQLAVSTMGTQTLRKHTADWRLIQEP